VEDAGHIRRLMIFFIKGIIIGVIVSAPVGPIGLLCVNRTLTQGRKAGFVSGLGAATADAVYCIIAGFGFTFISRFLMDQNFLIAVVGSLCLAGLGVKTFLSAPKERSLNVSGGDLAHVYVSTFALTLMNPVTILFFLALFSLLGLVLSSESLFSLVLLTSGVLVGAVAWWFGLASLASRVHHKLTDAEIHWINRISGILMIIIGVLVFFLASGW